MVMIYWKKHNVKDSRRQRLERPAYKDKEQVTHASEKPSVSSFTPKFL